jgi:hypothetical protein
MDAGPAIWNGVMEVSFWLQADDRADLIFFSLSFLLLGELAIRVLKRFLADRRGRIGAAKAGLRLKRRSQREES